MDILKMKNNVGNVAREIQLSYHTHSLSSDSKQETENRLCYTIKNMNFCLIQLNVIQFELKDALIIYSMKLYLKIYSSETGIAFNIRIFNSLFFNLPLHTFFIEGDNIIKPC